MSVLKKETVISENIHEEKMFNNIGNSSSEKEIIDKVNNEDGHNYYHNHEHHDHSHHNHHHEHKNTKAVINRLAKAIGHLQSVKRMVENGRDCSEVLIQLAAVISALNNAGKVILEDHINNCLIDAVESGDQKVIDDLNKVIGKFIK